MLQSVHLEGGAKGEAHEAPNPLFLIPLILLVAVSAASAADFGWIRNFNLQAEADPRDFRARLGARFNIGDMKIDAVLGEVEWPRMPTCCFGSLRWPPAR